jgi:catechol 2,3-dioxygenase-like lactoylglutathione lyase family enzyme
MAMNIEKISAVTFRVSNMKRSVQFYRDVLGMELLYGGEVTSFSSLQARDADSAILNLEQGTPVDGWGRLIFHVADVTRSGDASTNWGFSLKSRGMLPGANGTSTCAIPMGMSCRLLDR